MSWFVFVVRLATGYTGAERDSIIDGLTTIRGEIEAGTFDWRVDLEDVHMNIEHRLTERIGIAGKKLHTGRSRNDQVATDVRLWLRDEIDAILADYGVPSPVEWAKPGSYIQTTTRWQVEANRKKNDIVLIPVGCTELHGQHLPSASDTLYVSAICEGVRRFTAKRGAPVNLALPPLNYGGHPYHHVGMPGTVIVREHVVREMMIDVMLGLWNDGFRKQLIVNNHGQLWMLESAVQEFQKRYPAFVVPRLATNAFPP